MEGWWDPDKNHVALYGSQCSVCHEHLGKKVEYCKTCDWRACPRCDIFVDSRLDDAIALVKKERKARLAEMKRKKMGIQRIDKWFTKTPSSSNNTDETLVIPAAAATHMGEKKKQPPPKRKRARNTKKKAPAPKKMRGGLLRFAKR